MPVHEVNCGLLLEFKSTLPKCTELNSRCLAHIIYGLVYEQFIICEKLMYGVSCIKKAMLD
jgi:hypothetical protein